VQSPPSLPAGRALALALLIAAHPVFADQPAVAAGPPRADALSAGFVSPPDSARPWVYYFVMDGNLTREGITADFEAIQRAGLGGMIVMEVDIGIPRGPVAFMSAPWRELFGHAVAEATRLGLEITLNAGPGWTGSGGPWVKPGQSMQHLVASETRVSGPARFDAVLPQPPPRKPFFGEGALPPEIERARKEFYRDVRVLAFPTPHGVRRIADIDEKALYLRAPYSSQPGVKPFLPAPAEHPAVPPAECVAREQVLDLTARLAADGRLAWDVPPGDWTILRFGRTSTGQNTRPAPLAGLGLESDKFDRAALDAHFQAFVAPLLAARGPRPPAGHGWTMLHIDSWEMSAQNWTPGFDREFRQRRGYDPTAYLPALIGYVVGTPEIAERFLWDWRKTAQELVIENHARHLKRLGARHGLGLSIEPYDMNPAGDLSLGGEADVPMGEFWSKGHGFDTEFSCLEAVSVAHTRGRPVVAAEAFTATDSERWQLHPGALKAQGDWAFAAGINRIVFHRYQHQPWLDRWPGMTMGPYGVHWERTQTWWDLAPAYHRYLARCQFLLRQGRPVVDICYLAPEGAPHVFRPPRSALWGALGDRQGYNFDGCAPEVLIGRMSAKPGQLRLPHGQTYRVLVLPDFDTMTPALLRKIKELVQAGAMVVGSPPRKSPSLADHPRCDEEVRRLAASLWGTGEPPAPVTERHVGKGRVYWGGAVSRTRSQAEAADDPLAGAKWIWHHEGEPARSAPVGRRFFRREFALDAGAAIESARLAVTADNTFTAWVNGTAVGSGDNFHRTFTFEVAHLLEPGTNWLAIQAENGGDLPNPAGLIGALAIRLGDGQTLRVVTDATWQSAAVAGEARSREPARGGSWAPARVLGDLEMAPWNHKAGGAQTPDIYPDYELVAGILARAGIPPDFESSPRLRYTHRRDGDDDLYFVANPENRPLKTTAVFRVAGRQPELWDPVTGRQRVLPEFTETAGRTSVRLGFAAHQSFFVVFRKPANSGSRRGGNFPQFTQIAPVNGPWTIRFQPGRGAPAGIRSEALFDWSKHADAGVRLFCGLARYVTQFDWPPAAGHPPGASRIVLDLGRVAVMAGVTLNGRDLGVVWTAPFQVEATDALRPGRNTLEITVANLWPNRLIGDAGLPPAERVTWTTWNPFRPDSPLLESGLLGPVTLQTMLFDE
jgi:hypothetical protein